MALGGGALEEALTAAQADKKHAKTRHMAQMVDLFVPTPQFS
jgi:hypothetical protein